MSASTEEPLELSAPIAWEQAPLLCRRDASGADCCAWYHRPWQYLRLVGAITTAATNRSFLVDVVREFAADRGAARVLIPASADYAMLAYVAEAYRLAGSTLRATVVDLCRTPLMLNRWYADRFGIDCTTHCCNALEFTDAEPFDMIVTHNFLGRFEPEDRLCLLRSWYRLLRPGGRLVTTQRIRTHQTTRTIRFSAAEVVEFGRRVEHCAAAYPGTLAIPSSELVEAALGYATAKDNHNVSDPSQLLEPLAAAGFAVSHWDRGTEAERSADRPSAPIHDDDYRMRILAERGA